MYKFFDASVITWYFTLARKISMLLEIWNVSVVTSHLFSMISKLMLDYF